MAKVLISPGKYVQGAGEMKKLGEYAQNYGKKALILISKGGYKRIGAMVEKSFEGKECGYVFDYFNGECSKKEIKRLGEIVKKEACDVVIGIGGGKIFDTAKAVAYYEKTPVLICPTIASTDAPCSALSVIYTEEGVFEEYLFLPSNPDMVMMVFSFLREKFNSACQTVAVLNGTSQTFIGPVDIQKSGLSSQFCRRMRIGIGNQLKPVQHGHPPVHRRIRG